MLNANRLVALLGLLLLLGSAQLLAEQRLLDRVVAVVGEEALMESELQDRMQMVRSQIADRGLQVPPDEVLREQVMERLVIDTIQLQLAEENGLRIDEQTLSGTIDRIARQNNMTRNQFRQAIENDGMTFSAFREQIRQEMLISQVRQRQVGQRIQVSQQEIDNYLSSPEALEEEGREFRVGHILIPVPDSPSPEEVARAQEKAEELLNKIRKEKNFQEVAVSASAGDQAFSGGDLGWRTALALPSLFADRVVTLKEGEIAGPIRSPSGFHLIQLLETRGGSEQLVEQTRARHLLLTPNALRDEKATQALILQMRQRIQEGESLATLASEYSDDRASRQSGGDLGWVSPGQMVPAFEKAMQELEPGEISQPVQSRFGWHLIEVEERRQADVTDSTRRQQVQQLLSERRFEEEVQNWLREIRDSTWVEIRG
ncbi:peptidylprolyl isomerase [Marinospirillum sp.]|uniref:peptidylprolyl isomerase n=1 Tax=Marinospirillum sp. TaxID=2183934 RepID=UPI00286FD6E2|nr:peptidylprolyl isomerase [Marinospirillum sp.]MDR9466640.1 peptidylprolyl isomerase [Marinospirillum sp.]